MTNDEFLSEALQSGLAPSGFQEIYHSFEKYQELATETLREFHYICEKNKIWYQLAWGSLLGAVRDNGLIPWDYDVDVFVYHEDKDALITALKKDLSEKYYFYCPETDCNCRHFFMRVAPKGYDSVALHVDVFFLIGASDDVKQRLADMKMISHLSTVRFKKLYDLHGADYKEVRVLLKWILYKVISCTKSMKRIQAQYVQICQQYPIHKAIYCYSADYFAIEHNFKCSDIEETELFKTSIGTFRIPKSYDSILRELYGDYKKYFPVENRIKEVVNKYKVLQSSARF